MDVWMFVLFNGWLWIIDKNSNFVFVVVVLVISLI